MSYVFPSEIAIEVTGDGGWLCTEGGEAIGTEAGTPIGMEQPGFVDKTEDVRHDSPPSFEWGILGNDPLSRVAGLGAGKVRLDNSEYNAQGTIGYYSPGHANAWDGFGENGKMRMRISYGGTAYWFGLCEIVEMTPEPGVYGPRYVDLTGEGVMRWYDDYSEVNLEALEEGQDAAALYEELTSALRKKPPRTVFSSGGKALAYGFDTATRKRPSALNELNKIALSTLDYILVKGDRYYGATVFNQRFNERLQHQTSQLTLDNTWTRIEPDWNGQRALARVLGTYYPRNIGESEETLWTVTKPIQVRPGQTVTEIAPYRDPNQASVRIAGKEIDEAPEAGTDYTFGSRDDGVANDLNASLGVVVEPGATASMVHFTNNHDTLTGYVNTYSLKGKAIRFFETKNIEREADNPLSNKELLVDMPYEDNGLRAKDIVDVLFELNEQAHLQASSVTFIANESDAIMLAALTLEPGDRITLVDDVTISGDYFINGKRLRVIDMATKVLECTFFVEMAPPWDDFWLLNVEDYGELGTNTVTRGV